MTLPPDNTQDDLFWHALNYRTAATQHAEQMSRELEACITRRIAAAVAAEREANARLIESIELVGLIGDQLAELIRARSSSEIEKGSISRDDNISADGSDYDPAAAAAYWDAFSGRMFAFGLGASILRGLTVSGTYRHDYRALNDWLRGRLPDISRDEDARKYMERIRATRKEDPKRTP